MNIVRGILSFCYDFIVGDDWKIAAAVVTALGLSLALLWTEAISDAGVLIAGAGSIFAAFSAAVWVDAKLAAAG